MLDGSTILETELPVVVELRTLTAEDAGPFAEHIASDLDRLKEHLPWPATTATSAGAERWLGAYERGEGGRVLAAGAWSRGVLIGGAVLFRHDVPQHNVEIGCWVVAAGEGRGVALAACRTLLGVAVDTLHVERVEWRTTNANVRSRYLAEKLGFRYEGTLRSNYVLDGARCDTVVLSLVGGEITRAPATAKCGDEPRSTRAIAPGRDLTTSSTNAGRGWR